MRFIIITVIIQLCFLSTYGAKSDTTSALIRYSEIFRIQLEQDSTLNKELILVEHFLNKRYDSINIECNSSEQMKKYILNFSSSKSDKNKYNEYVILSAVKSDEKATFKIIYKLNSKYFSLEGDDFYNAIFNLSFPKKEGKTYLDITPDYTDYNRYSIENITFYQLDPFTVLEKKELEKDVSFYFEMYKRFEVKKKTQSLKIININYFSSLHFIGFDYAVMQTGITIPDENLLLSPGYLSNKHEMIHYILNGEYKFRTFINEGIATIYGGSGGQTYQKKLENVSNKITAEEREDFIKFLVEGKRVGGYFNDFYYAISAKLVDLYRMKEGFTDKELIDDLNNLKITHKEFIETHLEENIPSEFISTIF
ncbi:MAG: Uncharacterised protein [Flavobacteriaceae bacterium]|jgi:hypothetical protein|nr:MAG: Uncharacterised protein [Flavobacteriaceae bacterium]